MNKDGRLRAEAYYRQAGSWADEASAQLRRSRRTAWIVALVAMAIAVIEALTIWAMVPLRTVVPYTLLVDRNTGYVEALKPLEAGLLAPDKALTQSFLVQYVLAREGFDRATIRNDYRKVALWSGEPTRRRYLADMAATNPESPAVRLGARAIITARVRSVSTLQPGTALVRFETERTSDDRASDARSAAVRQYWVAVIRYRFSRKPMATEDRYVNPLGFEVLSYRRSPETLPAETLSAETPAPAPRDQSRPRAAMPVTEPADALR
jgi:type IV secretion system protein VirB8